jgi:hypothetical protein
VFQFDSDVVRQFIRAVDTNEFNPDPEDEAEPAEAVNRAFWNSKAKQEVLAVVDAMKTLTPTSHQGKPKLIYNKTHIALVQFLLVLPTKKLRHIVP